MQTEKISTIHYTTLFLKVVTEESNKQLLHQTKIDILIAKMAFSIINALLYSS